MPDMYSYEQKSAFDAERGLLKWPCFMSESKRALFSGGENSAGLSFLTPDI